MFYQIKVYKIRAENRNCQVLGKTIELDTEEAPSVSLWNYHHIITPEQHNILHTSVARIYLRKAETAAALNIFSL